MTSGLKALCFALLFLIAASPVRADWPGAWGLAQLGESLAETTEGKVRFREFRTVSYLNAPIELSGYVMRRGNRIEKHILSPFQESIVIDGDTVDVDTAEGEHHRFDVNDHGLIKGLATALQATLSGNLLVLEKQFDVILSGAPTGWTLHLTPLEADLRQVLPGITLTGVNGLVETIEIEGEHGDISMMTLQHTSP
ncbi:MAG: hypothetical protein P1V34_11630 [Alphaproteobacteria bacterium]|nr:hypothetical protein [Alphaproteobacteria bacterium]